MKLGADINQQNSQISFKKALEEYDKTYTTLVDYFAIIGPQNGDLYKAIENAKMDIKNPLTPQILIRTPEIDKPSIAFPSQITDFCFPEKLQIFTAQEAKESNQLKYQDVVLTSADGQSIYSTTLIFYDDLSFIEDCLNDYDEKFRNPLKEEQSTGANSNTNSEVKLPLEQIKDIIQDASKNSLKKGRTTRNELHTTKKVIRTVEEEEKTFGDFIMVERPVKLMRSFTKDLNNGKPQYQYDDDDEDLEIQQPTEEIKMKEEEEYKEVYEEIQPYEKLERGKYFLERGITILSRQPFFELFRLILIDIKRICDTGIKAPLEDIITHLLYSVPAPPRGILTVNLKLICKNHPYKNFMYKYPPINELPYANNDSIITLFDSLNVDNVLLFFKRILLDSNVKIALIIILEFDGQNAPVPFLMGIEEKMIGDAEENISDGTYIIDLDNNKITSKQKTSVTLQSSGRFRTQQKDDLPELPDHYAKKLCKSLKDIIKPRQRKQQRLSPDDVVNIREAFFQFFVNVFQNYEKYLTPNATKTVEGVSACFNYNKYIEETSSDQKQFFKHFLKLQMFTRLLERKLWANKNEDLIDTLYFDERIRRKNQKVKKPSKNQTFFLEDKSQDHRPGAWECDNLARLEKEITLELYQQIFQDSELLTIPMSDLGSQNKFYRYRVIPQYLSTTYMQDIFMKECYEKAPLKAFQQQLNASQRNYLDGVKDRKLRIQQQFDDMDKDVNVHLCWILIWIATLAYQDDNEKSFRLKQVKEVLQRINSKNAKLNLELFELLLDSCYKYGNLKMVLDIFDQIEEFKFKPNAAVMTYLLNGLSKNNQTMEAVQRLFKRQRDKEVPQIQNQSIVKLKVTEEIQRRLASAKRVFFDNIGIATGSRPSMAGGHNNKDLTKPVVQIDINDLNKPNKSTVQEHPENSLLNRSQTSLFSQQPDSARRVPTDQDQMIQSARSQTISDQARYTMQPNNLNNTSFQQQKTIAISLLDSKTPLYKKISNTFRRRSFLNAEEQEYFISDKVRLLLKEQCSKCKNIMFPKDIMRHTAKESENYYVFTCSCYQKIYPSLKVRVGDLNIYKNEDTMLINPIQLRQYLEERMALDMSYRNAEQLTPEILRDYNKNIYWNLIWYFADNHLPYDFIVPYADDTVFEEFLNLNSHLQVRNKMRLDQLVMREGGIDNYVKYVEERVKKEQSLKKRANMTMAEKKPNHSRASKGKKGMRKQESQIRQAQIDMRQSLSNRSSKKSGSKRSKSQECDKDDKMI